MSRHASRAEVPRLANAASRDSQRENHTPIIDLCEYSANPECQIKGQDGTLNIDFTETCLFWCRDSPRSTVSENPNALPTKSLADVLQTHGAWWDQSVPRAAKAALALSLGRSLLYLFRSPWTQQPWAAKHIHFLCSSRDAGKSEVDISKPHIECSVATTQGGDPLKLTVNDCSSSLNSLARLLIEIDTGKPLSCEVKVESLDDLLKSSPHYGMDDFKSYAQAVRQSVYFGHILQSAVTAKTGPSKPSRRNQKLGEIPATPSVVRKVMYEHVVSKLETHCDKLSAHTPKDAHRKTVVLRLPAAAEKSPVRDDPPPLLPVGSFSSRGTEAIENAKMYVQNLSTDVTLLLVTRFR